MDEGHHPAILYRPADYLYQLRVVHVVEELFQVLVDAEAVAIIDDGLRTPKGLVGSSVRTETKAVITELRLVQRLQDLRYVLPDLAVYYGRDAERTLLAVVIGYLYPSDWIRTVLAVQE